MTEPIHITYVFPLWLCLLFGFFIFVAIPLDLIRTYYQRKIFQLEKEMSELEDGS